MSAETFHRGELLAAKAECEVRGGNAYYGRLLYKEAAGLQAEVARGVPGSRPRTLGIVALSAVTCACKAEDWPLTIALGVEFGERPDVPSEVRKAIAAMVVEAYLARTFPRWLRGLAGVVGRLLVWLERRRR